MLASDVADTNAAVAELERASKLGKPYSVLLLDGSLLRDGPSELTELRTRCPAAAATGVVVLTSALQADTTRWRGSRVAATVTKPARPSDLLEAIQAASAAQPEPPERRESILQPAQAVPGPSARPLRILLAEDNPVNQLVATRLLERQGHTVTVVGDGRNALEILERERFDVVLMDVQMPDVDGLEAVGEIRRREALTGMHIPVIALTAHAMKGDSERCRAAGMDAYLSKPIQLAELRRVLDEICAPLA